MVLEHVGMPQPGDCRVVFSASAEELEAAIQAEQTAENPPQAEEDLLPVFAPEDESGPGQALQVSARVGLGESRGRG